jgi:hypothetical protein
MSFPFKGPPREVIFNRWKKDLKRYNLLDKYYPIMDDAEMGAATMVTVKLSSDVLVSQGQTATIALHGFAAYAILRTSLDTLAKKFGVSTEQIRAPRLDISFPDSKSISLGVPIGDKIHVTSFMPEKVLPAEAKWYDPFMDFSPEMAVSGQVAVMSIKRDLISISIVHTKGGDLYVVTPQYLLLFFLLEAHRATDVDTKVRYRTFYRHTREILEAAEKIFASATQPQDLVAAAADFASSPFFPSVTTMGTMNNDDSYFIGQARNAEQLKDTPPPALGLSKNISDILVGLPSSYYPKPNRAHPVFDYSQNMFFRRSGHVSPGHVKGAEPPLTPGGQSPL